MNNPTEAINKSQRRMLKATLHWLTGLALSADEKGYIEINVNKGQLAADIRQIEALTDGMPDVVEVADAAEG